MKVPGDSPPLHVRTRNCDKSLRQELAKRIHKLLKSWSADDYRRWPARSFSMPVRTISMRAMQVMVDLVMDLLDRIATEAASILELEGKDTLTLAEVKTSARLTLRDGKDNEHACQHYLELNLVNYANKKYTQYMS